MKLVSRINRVYREMAAKKRKKKTSARKTPQDPSLHSAEPKESDFKQAPRCAQYPPQKPEDPA